jgi:hypothetical protein
VQLDPEVERNTGKDSRIGDDEDRLHRLTGEQSIPAQQQ